jgi:hypothetical protein
MSGFNLSALAVRERAVTLFLLRGDFHCRRRGLLHAGSRGRSRRSRSSR